jgi:hypothetical protein
MSDSRINLSPNTRKLVRTRLQAAVEFHEKTVKLQDLDRWTKYRTVSERNKHLMKGSYWAELNRRDMLSVNHIFPAIVTKHAVVTAGDTEFISTPRQERFAELSDTCQAILNHVWGELRLDEQVNAAHWDSRIYPEGGVVEIGWHYKDGKRQVDAGRNDESSDRSDPSDPSDESDLSDPSDAGVYPDLDGAAGSELSPDNQYVQDSDVEGIADAHGTPDIDDPFIERFDPADFFWDPQCTDSSLRTARYAFRRKKVTLADLKRNKRYRNTLDLKHDELQYYAGSGEHQPEKLPEDVEDEFKTCVVYDVYMRLPRNGAEQMFHIVMPHQGDKELLAEVMPYDWGADENPFPFVVLPANTCDNDSFTATPDVSMVRDIQVSHDESYTQYEWHRAHTPSVLMVPEGTFSTETGMEAKRRIEEGKENAVIEVNQGFIQFVKWMERPAPNAEVYQNLETTEDRIQKQIGISEYQTNELPNKTLTATEAGALQQQGSARQESDIARFYRFITACGYKVLCLMQQFCVEPRAYGHQSEDGAQKFGQASIWDLRGTKPGSATEENPAGELEDVGVQFELDISPNKVREKNRYTERHEWIDLMGTVQPFIGVPDPRLPTRPLVNIPALLAGIFSTFDLTGKSKIILPDPTPQELAQAQQQTQQGQQPAPAVQMKQAELAQKAQDSQVRAQTEIGKAHLDAQSQHEQTQAQVLQTLLQHQHEAGMAQNANAFSLLQSIVNSGETAEMMNAE